MRTSSIRLRANARVAVLHEDLLEICNGNMLAAMLLSTLIYWTDVKIAQKDENLWIWKTQEGFQEDLMFDKPGMKPPHRTTISSALDLLKNKGFIGWRKNPKMALDRTRQYLTHLDKVQEAIDKLPVLECRKTDNAKSEKRLSEEAATEADSGQSSNVGKPTMQSRNTDNALSEKQHSNVGKPTSNTSDYSYSDYSPVITGGTYGDGSREQTAQNGTDVPTPARDLSQDESLIPGHDPHAPHLAVNCKAWRVMFGGLEVATCQQYQSAINTTRERRALEDALYRPEEPSQGTIPIASSPEGDANDIRLPGAGDTRARHDTGPASAHAVGAMGNTQTAAGDPGASVRLPATGTDTVATEGRATDGDGPARAGAVGDGVAREQAPGSGYRQDERPSQATLTATRPPQGAYQAPTRGSRGTRGSTSKRVYFSTEGAAFRAWYEEVFEVQIDETPANAVACNSLGGRGSVTYENVSLVKDEIGLNKWARTNNVAVTPQDLADDDGPIRWEKWLQAAQKRAKKAQEKPAATGTNNLADWIVEDRNRQAPSLDEAQRALAETKALIAERRAARQQQQAVIYQVNPRDQGGTYV